MKEQVKISEESIVNMFMVFGMMLKAVENAAVSDISLLFSREDKRQYNRAKAEIDKLIRMFSAKFPKEVQEFMDEGSFAFLDTITLMRSIEHADKVKNLFMMMKLYVDGDGFIKDDSGEELQIEKDALYAKEESKIETEA
jgi:hypothetical protein